MKIVIEVPDECAEGVTECIAWLEARKLSSFGEVISVSPGDDPHRSFWGARLMSMEIPGDCVNVLLEPAGDTKGPF